MCTNSQTIQNLVSEIIGFKVLKITKDAESAEYFGHNIFTDFGNIKYRKSKITPKKNGQFVTLWKRNDKNITEPFTENDSFDFYIIASQEDENLGFFLFPKKDLSFNGILSTSLKEGKRGFRVYPTWTKPESKQAEKTQKWQSNYFINLSLDANKNKKLIDKIISIKDNTSF